MSTDTRRPSEVRTTTLASVGVDGTEHLRRELLACDCGELTVDDLSDRAAAQIAEVGDRGLVHPANRPRSDRGCSRGR